MNKVNHILFVASININGKPLGGDHFKNRLIYKELKNTYNVSLLDTFKMKKNLFYFINFLCILLFSKYDVLVLSINSFSVLKILKIRKIINLKTEKVLWWVMGGSLPDILRRNNELVDDINCLKGLGVQTLGMKFQLESFGLSRVYLTPNFKLFSLSNLNSRKFNLKLNNQKRLRLVYISRISEQKGIFEIIELINTLNKLRPGCFVLDIYGPIEDGIKDKFLNLIENNHV